LNLPSQSWAGAVLPLGTANDFARTIGHTRHLNWHLKKAEAKRKTADLRPSFRKQPLDRGLSSPDEDLDDFSRARVDEHDVLAHTKYSSGQSTI
jgi:hypothetical protein